MDRDPSLRSSAALLNRIDKLSADILQRYMNIVMLAKPSAVGTDDEEQNASTTKTEEADNSSMPKHLDRRLAAANTLKMEVETAELTRKVHDLLSLTRQMKELWLFGQLDTLSRAGVESAEEDASKVAEQVRALLGRERQGLGDAQVPNAADGMVIDAS